MAGCIGDKCSNCPLLPILAAIAFNTGFEEICPRLFSPSPLSLSRSNQIQVLSIVFFWMREDDCFFQWVSGHRQSDRRQVSQPLVRWWSAGRRWRSTTRALLTAHNESAILFRIWRFFLTLSQRWIFRYGCVGCVRKKRIHYWAKIVVFWLSSDPQHKSFLLTLIQGSVVFDGSFRRNHWLGQLVCQRTTLHSN